MFAGIQRERDPNLIHFEHQVFGLLRDIGKEEDERVGFKEMVKFQSGLHPSSLSLEDAIKELIEIEKNLK